MAKSIQMNYYNGTDYDVLYPESLASQIIYNEDKLDSFLSNMKETLTITTNNANTALSNSNTIKNKLGSFRVRTLVNNAFISSSDVTLFTVSPTVYQAYIFIPSTNAMIEIRGDGGAGANLYGIEFSIIIDNNLKIGNNSTVSGTLTASINYATANLTVIGVGFY